LTLDPFPAGLPPDDPDDSGTPPNGFVRALRFHNHLTVSTAVNEQPARLFLIDSGASVNMIDTALAKEFTGVHRDSRAALQGVQGRVKDVGRADRVTLSFAGFRQRNLGLLSMDMEKLSDSFGASISGILGMPLLWNMKLTIDYGNGAVRFEYVPDRRGR
jgi:predicted alpha/beta hydrolase